MRATAPGPGILPSQALARAIAEGWVRPAGDPVPAANVQPASLDLRLGAVAHRLRCSFLPEGAPTVEEKLEGLSLDSIDLAGGAVLERNRPYLIPLQEELALPEGVRGRTNPKSSTGRLDVFTRVITDRGARFDEIAPGLPRAHVPRGGHPLVRRARRARALAQPAPAGRGATRAAPTPRSSPCTAEEPLLFADGRPVPAEDLAVADGLFLRIDLTREGGVGYKARRNAGLLDLSRDRRLRPGRLLGAGARRARSAGDPGARGVLPAGLRPRACASRPGWRAEMTAYDPTAGELRTHYAGFFDPGFGYGPERAGHPRAVLEVRAHDVPFMVEHGQRVCKLGFERMAEPPELLYGRDIGSSYQDQELTVSKHFRAAGHAAGARAG